MDWLKKILEDNGVTVSEDLMYAVNKSKEIILLDFFGKISYNIYIVKFERL